MASVRNALGPAAEVLRDPADDRADRLLDLALACLKKAGLVGERTTQRIDSTHVLAGVPELTRLELVTEGAPCRPRSVSVRQASMILPDCTAADASSASSRPGKTAFRSLRRNSLTFAVPR